MARNRILVLADDLTGALEVGAKFAAAGVDSRVLTLPGLGPLTLQAAEGALVVDTETRHATPAEAARQVFELARAARDEAYAHLYKKTDSTLRGNIGAELAALIEAFDGAPVLYVPAYPQMGRTVVNGSLYVDGVPVVSTAFSHDGLNPVRESHIPSLLAAQCRFPARLARVEQIADSSPWSVVVCDGETDADVETAAQAFAGSEVFKVAAGPSAFAAHWARLVNLPRRPCPALPSVRTALVVNGSRHEASLRQVAQAKRDGFHTIGAGSSPGVTADGGWFILEQAPAAGTSDYAGRLVEAVCQILARSAIEAVVVFGGDTAYALVEALGHPPLVPLGELMEGIPVAAIEAKQLSDRIGPRDRDLYLVTKAGGFGPPHVVASLRGRLV